MTEKVRELGAKALAILKHLFGRNLTLKVISLVFGIVLWSYVINITNPSRERSIADVSLSVDGIQTLASNNLALTRDPYSLLASVDVRVRAPYNEVTALSAENIVARIDLSQINHAGTFNLKINATTRNGEVLAVSPDRVSVVVEALVEREIPVLFEKMGELASDIHILDPVISLEYVIIRGPESAVNQVTHAVCSMDMTSVRENITATLPLELRNAENKTIDSQVLRFIGNDSAIVSLFAVPIREFPLLITQNGQMPTGYRLTDTAISTPATVRIAAQPALLDQLESIYLEGIDISELTSTRTVTADLILPEGILWSDITRARVQFTVEEITISRQLLVPITYRDMDPALTRLSAPTSLLVVVTGPQLVVQSLTADDVVCEVSLENLYTGMQQLKPYLYVKGYTIEPVPVNASTVQVILVESAAS